VTTSTAESPAAVYQGGPVEGPDERPQPWGATVGSRSGVAHWQWTCPECGIHQAVANSAVDLSCTGPEDWRHPRRVGLRPDRWTSGPAALVRHLGNAGTVERLSLVAGYAELLYRVGAAEALELAAGECHVPDDVRAWLLERAAAHLEGSL